MVSFWEIVRRSESGPIVSEKEFDINFIGSKILELQKEYDIRYDPENLIPIDDDLVDKVWQAAIDLLLHAGVYHLGTKRCIRFSEEEIKDELKTTPRKIKLGIAKDEVEVISRKVEDSNKPVIFGGPHNAPVSENLFIKLNQAYAQERLINVLLMPGQIQSIEGMMVRAGSALEVQAARCYGEWARSAIRKAGRPNIAIVAWAGGVTSLNELAASDPENGLRRLDPRCVIFMPELKVDDLNLSKAAYYLSHGCPIYCAFLPLIGGFAGDPAGTAIIAVAYHIASRVVFKASILHFGPQHLYYHQQSNPQSIFMNSLAGQAVSKNSSLIRVTSATVSARPFTEQIHYEGAAIALASVTSGSHVVGGPRPAKTLFLNHVSPLDTRVYAKVSIAASKIKKEDANEIIKELIKKYEDKIELDKAPIGKPFEECYDLETLTPKKDYVELCNKVEKELIELGIPIDD
ncbi:MAG: monomethylamine:corrinoid methyltransferase [Candidatus Bathyarchaeia archaeon]